MRDQRASHPHRPGAVALSLVRCENLMSPFAIVALSLSMSADAFAASISRGAATKPNLKGALLGALVFGSIETVTPLVGWAIGLAAAGFVGAVDHWIAFTLLGIVGGKMIWEALRREPDEDAPQPAAGRGFMILAVTALGTSIDAAAVGVSLALVGANILVIAFSIGLATFTMTAIGLMIGRAAGHRLGSIVEIVGGAVLIGIGTLILVEHLGIFG
jgi:putative Mn2+ efflux pump MntP